MSEHQITMVSLDELVSTDHQYRRFKSLFNFKAVERELLVLETEANYKGYGTLRLFKCLLLQFMEDLSDQELERYLADSTAGKWFCDFALTEMIPDYSVFSKIRKKIGTNLLSKIFTNFRDQLRKQGYKSEVFTFVDVSHLISKASLWEERDELRKQKYDKLNNKSLSKVANDKRTKIGCKGGNKFWYGYKKHVSVDIQSGIINKVAVTPANVTDSKGFKHVMPHSGTTYVDKAYCTKPVKDAATRKEVHLCAVKKNNMQDKNFDLDKYYTKIRAPFERVFSQDNKHVRYIGIVKIQFSEFMKAICFNLKRLTVLTGS
ncbi:transposase [Rickettsia asembonensis]|uniref:transposase n=1 Tax=Rickettsia asembonensis TaxID=1068590 RepID=UPI0023F7A140|nr:transposase [Rickettsia asembonensis]WCR56399.1 MAG: IS5 family transposase ISFw2 [Rickettsia asembonensis]